MPRTSCPHLIALVAETHSLVLVDAVSVLLGGVMTDTVTVIHSLDRRWAITWGPEAPPSPPCFVIKVSPGYPRLRMDYCKNDDVHLLSVCLCTDYVSIP